MPAAENASVAASIFVNPLQFGAGEDLARYPRDFERDAALFETAGVALLYAPSAAAMYPAGFSSSIDPGAVAREFEGSVRPGHFAGVATVVIKLLNTLEPERLYLGRKDAQQVAVLRTVVRDLDLPVEIVAVPTVREATGSRSRAATSTSRRRIGGRAEPASRDRNVGGSRTCRRDGCGARG